MVKWISYFAAVISIIHATRSNAAGEFQVSEEDERIVISSPTLDAVVRKKGYVTGVAAGSFLDKKIGFRDAGYGLDIVDWIMEPGSDEAYRVVLGPYTTRDEAERVGRESKQSYWIYEGGP